MTQRDKNTHLTFNVNKHLKNHSNGEEKQINFARRFIFAQKVICYVWINNDMIDKLQVPEHLHRNVNISKYQSYKIALTFLNLLLIFTIEK